MVVNNPFYMSLYNKGGTLQGINISHLGKRKIIVKMPFFGDMLVSWRVFPRRGGQYQYHDPLVYSSDYRSQMSKFCMISLPLEIKFDNPVDIHNSSISMKPLLMHQEGMNLRCRPQLPKNLHHVYFPSSVCTIET